MARELLYQKIANIIHGQIQCKALQAGDKLPSIREIQRSYGVSINTVKQAYLELESKSLIESRPKIGYYVSWRSGDRLPLPSVSEPKSANKEEHAEDLISKVFSILGDKNITPFSLGIADTSMLPVTGLNRSILKTLRNLNNNILQYEPVQGSINLRRSIVKSSFIMEGKLSPDDIITTSGAMNSIFKCLMAVTNRGDTIAVESPIYFGILQVAHAMGLNVIELPTHPLTGVDLDALKKVLSKIKACCFIPNFSNPLGSLMPEVNKITLVRMLTDHDIPLIEDDLYGNLFFGASRPKPCKAYDEAGIVMWCGSVSKELAPGFRVGWIAPGKYKSKLIRLKLIQTISTPSLYQEAVADFLENGRYKSHLREFRKSLHQNCLKFQQTIAESFPQNTKVSQPQGGLVLWLELDRQINTTALYDLAIRQQISIAPGRIFTQHDQYNNCMRLNFATKWNERTKLDLKRLGNMVYSQISRRH